MHKSYENANAKQTNNAIDEIIINKKSNLYIKMYLLYLKYNKNRIISFILKKFL